MLNIKIYYQVIAIKTVWYCQKNRNLDQWNSLEMPKINPHIYNQLIFFYKQAKIISWKKNSLFKNGMRIGSPPEKSM